MDVMRARVMVSAPKFRIKVIWLKEMYHALAELTFGGGERVNIWGTKSSRWRLITYHGCEKNLIRGRQ